MLLTISTTHQPPSDLGHLLRKNPERVQEFTLSFGKAHVFYPEVSDEQCTAALLLEVDPVGLVRRNGPAGEGRTLEQYVNDRPYVASSFLSVAIADVFGSALSGKSKERPELVDQPIPLTATIAVLPCRGGETFLRKLFEPLGYRVTATSHPLDARFPEWGESCYYTVTLEGTVPVRTLLSHLYVLIPVLDNDKHYWVGDDEVAKLLRHGESWLAAHPERNVIARRYLKHRRSLIDSALARLTEAEQDVDQIAQEQAEEADKSEERVRLNDQRIDAVVEALRSADAKRVLDLGCGSGQLIRALLKEKPIQEIVGLDVSHRSLEIAADRLRLDRLPKPQASRVHLLHGSLTYRDKRLAGYDAAAVIEVVEHLDPPRLAAFERVLFECARPTMVILTTPNSEYNVKWESLPAGQFRHKDHRFEWTRAQFQDWTRRNAERFGYQVELRPIGAEDPVVGPPTQMAIFRLIPPANATSE